RPSAALSPDASGDRLLPSPVNRRFPPGRAPPPNSAPPPPPPADSIVTIAQDHAGYGRLVVVDHGFGITTWYAHLSSISAVAGTRIKRGETVGYTGISGRATGPHVHYEVRMNNAPVNPFRYMKSNTATATAADLF